MTTFRLVLVAVGLFALTFVGVSWGKKGFPAMMAGNVSMKPDSRLPTFEWSPERGRRRDWENSKTSQSDGNAARDKLRLDLLQASNGYELSPCDDTTRVNLVQALISYTQAWHEMAHCRPGVGDCPSNGDERFDVAAAAFNTPADIRVHEALRKAFEQGGLSREDFPAPLRAQVHLLVQGWFGEPQAVCIAAQQARHQ